MFVKTRRTAMARTKVLRLGLALAVLGVPAMAWAQTQQVATTPVAASASPQASVRDDRQTDANGRDPHERHPRYQVQCEDIIALSFPLSPEFDQTVTIQPDGYISLTGTTSLYIQGMTVPEVVEAVKKAYAKTLHDPIVQVDLQDFQRPFFTVSGQVGKPGQYELRHDTTVAEAIGVAGGFSPSAKTQIFLFHRVSTGWFEVKKLNMNDVLSGKNINEDPTLGAGDMVFVPEKFITKFRKYIPYYVGTSISPALY
jgi:polysaccharide biosynthesis/export protein